MSPFRIYAPELRKLGFTRVRVSRLDGVRRVHYRKLITRPDGDVRRLLVRVQADNLNEAMHRPAPAHCIDPRGTAFYTIPEMRAAIEQESAAA